MLTPFLLPPGIFVALGLLISVVLLRKNKKSALFCFVFSLSMWAASLGYVGNTVLSKLEYIYTPPADIKADVLVVLSGGMIESAPSVFKGKPLSSFSLERIAECARLYHKYKLPVIVTGGSVSTDTPEALAMKAWLIDLGVPANKISIEDKARDTWENAFYTKQVCDDKGYTKIALITSAAHMERSMYSFKKAGFKEPVACPTAYRTVKKMHFNCLAALPGDFDSLRIAAHERIGLVFYKLQHGN